MWYESRQLNHCDIPILCSDPRKRKSFHREDQQNDTINLFKAALCHIPHRIEVKSKDCGSRALQQGRFYADMRPGFLEMCSSNSPCDLWSAELYLCKVSHHTRAQLAVFVLLLCPCLLTCCALLRLCVSTWWVICSSMLQTRGRGVMCTSVGSTSKNSRPRPCCRRSLQHCAAMIPFDAAEKKVTGGAWFDILLNYLLAGLSKVEFRSFCRPKG